MNATCLKVNGERQERELCSHVIVLLIHRTTNWVSMRGWQQDGLFKERPGAALCQTLGLADPVLDMARTDSPSGSASLIVLKEWQNMP